MSFGYAYGRALRSEPVSKCDREKFVILREERPKDPSLSAADLRSRILRYAQDDKDL